MTTIHSYPLVRDRVALVPYSFAKQRKVLPIAKNTEGVTVASANLLDFDSFDELRLLLQQEIVPIYFSHADVDEAIEQCYHQKEDAARRLFSEASKVEMNGALESGTEGYDLLESGEQNPIVRMVNMVFVEAIQQQASDIHFEPTEEGVSIRYRIDGILQVRHNSPRELYPQLLARIKVMAKMDVSEHRLPQDGRLKLHYGGRGIDFRVSSLPVVNGERIVLRVLDKGNVLLGLNCIGIDERQLKAFRKLIQSPEGIILVTGPTGSGKTTTLYSAISELNSLETNIMTIEDPVEYKLPGISQMNVNPRIDLDFAKGLRHMLRQDPDVILIGEIRDKETAEISIQSSLTGHLVFSTLHTNDAPSALTRLIDMGIEPYLLASSVLGILAQRLVRCICLHCRTPYTPTEVELAECGGAHSQEPFFKGIGCDQCFGTGYKGRQGIYELLIMNALLKHEVLLSQDAERLRSVAIQAGMVTLFQNGVELVRRGITTSTELLRIT